MRRRGIMGLLGMIALVLVFATAACGGGGGSGDEAAAQAETTAPAETAAVPAETGAAAAPSGEPLVIGAAIDLTGPMSTVDSAPFTAAQIEVEKVNAAGGIAGRPVELKLIETGSDPERTKAAAIDLLEGGAEILYTTCDVDFATPAVQEAISRGVLALAPCIGTDQMGPKRFGEAGRLAFSLGNLAQDEGAAMAEYAYEQRGWKTAATAQDNLLVYFQNVIEAFTKRFEELGGKIVQREEWTQGDGTVQSVASSLADTSADVIVMSTDIEDKPALVSGLRSLGNETPIICTWACDGEYWMSENTSNVYSVTYGSLFGDDPRPEFNELLQEVIDTGGMPTTSGFVTGAATIQMIKAVVEQAGSTDGEALATVIEGLQDFPTISGLITFSPEQHTVVGRTYQVIEFQGGKGSRIGEIKASSPADIGG